MSNNAKDIKTKTTHTTKSHTKIFLFSTLHMSRSRI